MNHDYRNDFTCNLYKEFHKLSNGEERLTSNEKMYHDKTTYCRPIINYYNEEFIYKTMERNARLKRLVRKLAIARRREKESVSWNNFINELKNKHGLKSEKPGDEPTEYITPEIIDDYYNTKFSCVQSRPCKHLLQEFYGVNDESQSNCTYYRQFYKNSVRQSDIKKYFPHEKNPYCYPTSSQGRLIMLDRERRLKQSLRHWPYHLSDKNVNIKSEIGKRCFDGVVNTKLHNENSIRNFNISHNRATSYDTQASGQTYMKYYPNFVSNKYQDKATYKIDDFIEDRYETYKNVEKLQENNQQPTNYLKKISLINIDTKIETLIESINTFIDEIKLNKSKRKKFKENCFKCRSNDKSENTNVIENNSINKVKTVKIVDTPDLSENTFYVSNLNRSEWPSKVDKFFDEHSIQNPKRMQINEFTNQPCSVQISFEVPTKDCSTEVTKSLSKQNTCSNNKEGIIEEIATPEHIPSLKQMAIAVNTDPLSFLSLLQISTDTFKRLLSYVPNFDYYSYLSLLQFPLSTRKIEPHYVCNICGADFNKPSKLSDHIRDHNLGKTKDCCVCRHVLDSTRKSSGLFRCRYCGQLFARAYCCELHQESCARRLGRHHDVSSSLMLLR